MNYIPHTEEDRRAMLEAIGVGSDDELFADVPPQHRFPELNLAPGVSQMEAEEAVRRLSERNLPAASLACFLGAGAYNHYVPHVVDALVSRGEFLTAYTPYQPEISQGTLQSIFEYQSLIAALTGMDVSNASLYDGGTALAEASLMAARTTRRNAIVLADSLHPAHRAVTDTYIQALELARTGLPFDDSGRLRPEAVAAALGNETACLAVGYPNFFGVLEDLESLAAAAHDAGALLIVATNPLALGMLPPPGELGADIVVGEGQPLGLGLQFGGPYLGLLATTRQHMRQMPGRVVGETVDTAGRRGYVMTLRAREQDIRRDKATSNICTNQALAALVATIYMSAMGERGLSEVAAQCYHKAHYAHSRICALDGYEAAFTGPFFHEFAVRLPEPVTRLNVDLLAEGILGPYDLGRDYPDLGRVGLFCVTEMNSRAQIDHLIATLEDHR